MLFGTRASNAKSTPRMIHQTAQWGCPCVGFSERLH